MPGAAPVEATNEMAVDQHLVALGDALQRPLADGRMPHREEEEEALAHLRNREPELGEPSASQGDMRLSGPRNRLKEPLLANGPSDRWPNSVLYPSGSSDRDNSG